MFFSAVYSHSKALVPSCACMHEAIKSLEAVSWGGSVGRAIFCHACPSRNQREGMLTALIKSQLGNVSPCQPEALASWRRMSRQ